MSERARALVYNTVGVDTPRSDWFLLRFRTRTVQLKCPNLKNAIFYEYVPHSGAVEPDKGYVQTVEYGYVHHWNDYSARVHGNLLMKPLYCDGLGYVEHRDNRSKFNV